MVVNPGNKKVKKRLFSLVMTEYPDHIIFFDGVCNLCNHSVQFIIKHDTRNLFFFCPLQSDIARIILAGAYPSDHNFETILYFEKGLIYSRSMAVMRIAEKLDFPYNMISWFKILPRKFRDGMYRFISRNRYKWFGKKDHCMIPTPELKNKFLVSSL
jgi:predicted DCC family thiol-disulfide oxidoreductase YuxK